VTAPPLSATVLGNAGAAPVASLAIVAEGQLSVSALEALILRDPTYRVIKRARGTAEVRDALATFMPAVLVVESQWPAWPAALEPARWSGHTLLLLDPEDEPAQFVRAARAQADGYLSRGASRDGFATAIRCLRESGGYLDPVLAGPLHRASAGPLGPGLSPRERDILVGVAAGRSSKEIARQHAIAPKTVCNHVNNICQKLKLRHRGQLVLYAAQHGLATL